MHNGYDNIYCFVKDGKNIIFVPLKRGSKSKSSQLITTNLLPVAHRDCNFNAGIKEVEGANVAKEVPISIIKPQANLMSSGYGAVVIPDDENKSPLKEIQINQILSLINPLPPYVLPSKSIEPIVVLDYENFVFGKEMIFDKFSPMEEYFPVKTKKVELLINLGKNIKFVWTMKASKVVTFALSIWILRSQMGT